MCEGGRSAAEIRRVLEELRGRVEQLEHVAAQCHLALDQAEQALLGSGERPISVTPILPGE